MRRIVGGFIMATGLLGAFLGGASGAETGKTGSPRSNAMKTEAPSGNPLDAVMDDIYRREMSGQITHDQAMEIYGAAVKKATPEQIREHSLNMDKRP